MEERAAAPVVEPKPAEHAHELLVEAAFQKKPARQRVKQDEDVFDAVNFKRIHNKWWLDLLFPDGVIPYFATALLTCTVVWLIGLFIRLAASGFVDAGETTWVFIKTREWQMQPLLLFANFLALRLFKGIFSRNFDRAFEHLDVSIEAIERYRAWIFGMRVNLGAVLLSLPFLAYKVLLYFPSPAFLADYQLERRGGEAWYLMALWSVEWVIFGYYCYLLLAGSAITWRVLRKHEFIESVDLVLAERHYSPLFNTTAQAASLVFFFALIHAGYVFYSAGDWADYVALGVLVLLLGLSFGTTWIAVRRCLSTEVSEATQSLEASYRAAREKLASMTNVPGIEDDIHRIQVQLKMALALQQMEYLNSKYESVGRREMAGMMVRMMAPVGGLVARAIRWGSLLAALGLGSAAIFSAERKDKDPPKEISAPAKKPSNSDVPK